MSSHSSFGKALLDSVAHNLKTPLTSIIGALNTLQNDGERIDRATRLELIEMARVSADRLNRLIGNLLDIGRVDAGAFSVRLDPCELPDVVGAAFEQLGAAASSRLIEARIPPDLPFVRMDFVLIVQVLVNLLDNSLKYAPLDSAILLDVSAARHELIFSVRDSGAGVPEEYLGRIFDRYDRAGRSGETTGIGLGLAICKAIVEAHSGSIWAERRQPRGFAVNFSLPMRSSERAS